MPEAATSPERYTLAVVTDDELYPEIRRHLGQELRTVLACTENEIKNVLEQAAVHAILFNLDCIGDGAIDGLDGLAEMRKIRDDVVSGIHALEQPHDSLEGESGRRRRILLVST